MSRVGCNLERVISPHALLLLSRIGREGRGAPRLRRQPLNPVLPEKSIAALSFENFNREQNSAFLAHEMNDDLLTKLPKIPI